jgi:hypothetical protein
MDSHAGEPNFDRQSAAERYRQEWKNMKLKKKAKWIKKAADKADLAAVKVGGFMGGAGPLPPGSAVGTAAGSQFWEGGVCAV